MRTILCRGRLRVPSLLGWMLAVMLTAAGAACSDTPDTSGTAAPETTTTRAPATTAAPVSAGACRSGQVLGPGDSCTVDSNVFEVQPDGRACFGGSICVGTGLNLNQFQANRIAGSDDWRIDANNEE